MSEPILLRHTRAPGDIVCMTAVVRDLTLTYPGKYEIHVCTSCQTLWQDNPYVEKVHGYPPKGMRRYDLTYGHVISQLNRQKVHFITAFHRNLREKSGIDVPVLYPKGDLHLDDWHKTHSPVEGRYWCIIAGGKTDFTTKLWSAVRYQQTVNVLRRHGLRFVQLGATYTNNKHPYLEGTLNLVGKTNLRDVLWLIYHSEGVICTITCFMHMAAAFDKPCVVLAGGREHWWFEYYGNIKKIKHFGNNLKAPVQVPHRFLHTQGLLDCCHKQGCWKNKVFKTERDKNKSFCRRPTDDGYGQVLPECHRMITVSHVVEAVLSYYDQGVLKNAQHTEHG